MNNATKEYLIGIAIFGLTGCAAGLSMALTSEVTNRVAVGYALAGLVIGVVVWTFLVIVAQTD